MPSLKLTSITFHKGGKMAYGRASLDGGASMNVKLFNDLVGQLATTLNGRTPSDDAPVEVEVEAEIKDVPFEKNGQQLSAKTIFIQSIGSSLAPNNVVHGAAAVEQPVAKPTSRSAIKPAAEPTNSGSEDVDWEAAQEARRQRYRPKSAKTEQKAALEPIPGSNTTVAMPVPPAARPEETKSHTSPPQSGPTDAERAQATSKKISDAGASGSAMALMHIAFAPTGYVAYGQARFAGADLNIRFGGGDVERLRAMLADLLPTPERPFLIDADAIMSQETVMVGGRKTVIDIFDIRAFTPVAVGSGLDKKGILRSKANEFAAAPKTEQPVSASETRIVQETVTVKPASVAPKTEQQPKARASQMSEAQMLEDVSLTKKVFEGRDNDKPADQSRFIIVKGTHDGRSISFVFRGEYAERFKTQFPAVSDENPASLAIEAAPFDMVKTINGKEMKVRDWIVSDFVTMPEYRAMLDGGAADSVNPDSDEPEQATYAPW